MNRKVIIMLIVISLIIIGSIGIHFFTNNKSNTDFNVLDDLSNLKNEKSTILKVKIINFMTMNLIMSNILYLK